MSETTPTDDRDEHGFDWEPRGEPGDGRGWQLPEGKECAERFLAGNHGPQQHPEPGELMEFVTDRYDAGDTDLYGGVSASDAAERFDIRQSTARSKLNELVDVGAVVRVDGMRREPPRQPRKSYVPAKAVESDAEVVENG